MRIGTRGSALALAQAGWVAGRIEGAELVPIRTSGDEDAAATSGPGDKSRFVREIERALLDGEIELAVHSAKDVPGELPDGLELSGVPEREDPADAWVGEAERLDEVREGARVGTASLRRRSQLLALRPDLEVVELRGNVDTRLRRLDEGELDGIVLAAAGLHRLGRSVRISFTLSLEDMTPAPGQGSLALESREDDTAAFAAAAGLTNREALVELTAERAAVAGLDASCDTPVGVCARHDGEALVLRGYAGLPDGTEHVHERVDGDPAQPVALGEALVERMAARGALELLARAEGMAR